MTIKHRLRSCSEGVVRGRWMVGRIACAALFLVGPLASGADEVAGVPDKRVATQNATADATAIDRYIAAQARRERGEEFRDARQRVDGDVLHRGAVETVVLYTIESQGGSNDHRQYLAVFARRNGSLQPVARVEAGGKSGRGATLIAIDAQGIALGTQEYADGDPSCCPSRKGHTHFVLEHDRLVEHPR
jgi:hypothetical protein